MGENMVCFCVHFQCKPMAWTSHIFPMNGNGNSNIGEKSTVLNVQNSANHYNDSTRHLSSFFIVFLWSRQQFSEVYLVTNADKWVHVVKGQHTRIFQFCVCVHTQWHDRYKHYERWASAHEFPLHNIINDGSTTYENRYCIMVMTYCFSLKFQTPLTNELTRTPSG